MADVRRRGDKPRKFQLILARLRSSGVILRGRRPAHGGQSYEAMYLFFVQDLLGGNTMRLANRGRCKAGRKRRVWLPFVLAIWLVVIVVPPAMAQEPTSADVPAGAPAVPEYNEGGGIQPLIHAPIIRVYRDSIPWFGENRDHNTLVGPLGKILGDDYFLHPVAACAGGIPAGTARPGRQWCTSAPTVPGCREQRRRRTPRRARRRWTRSWPEAGQ